MDFKTWCSTKKYYSKLTPNISHTFMDGGCLYVPLRDHDLFYEKYSKCIKCEDISLVERKTKDKFRLALDLDILDVHAWSDEKILECVRFIQTVIYNIYKEEHPCIICKAAKAIKNNKIKTGIHLHWPTLITNMANTGFLYNKILESCIGHFGERPDYNTWSMLIDACITKDIGLRVVGSVKFENKKKTGRPYVFYNVLKSNGEINILRQHKYNKNKAVLIKDTSIRYWGRKELSPLDFVPTVASEKISVPTKKTICHNSKALSPTTEDYVKISEYMVIALPKCYSSSQIKDIYKCNNGDYYFVHLSEGCSGKISTYCQNVQRKHKSNHIYWIIMPEWSVMFQKCHSNSSSEFKKCSEYCSPDIPFSTKLKQYFLSPRSGIVNLLNK